MQKPADLEGECPFLSNEGPCPYGLACRFSGTHKENVDAGTANMQRKSSEVNGLNKDVQKLLWKNKRKFPKSDATLKSLGLLVCHISSLRLLLLSGSIYVFLSDYTSFCYVMCCGGC